MEGLLSTGPTLSSFQTVLETSRQSVKFPDSGHFLDIVNASFYFEKCSGCRSLFKQSQSLWKVWKDSGESEKFLDNMNDLGQSKSFQRVWMETFWNTFKVSGK